MKTIVLAGMALGLLLLPAAGGGENQAGNPAPAGNDVSSAKRQFVETLDRALSQVKNIQEKGKLLHIENPTSIAGVRGVTVTDSTIEPAKRTRPFIIEWIMDYLESHSRTATGSGVPGKE